MLPSYKEPAYKELIKNKKKIEYNIQSQFLSKKNNVFKVNYQNEEGKTDTGVLKVFGKRLKQLEKEVFMLTMLKDKGVAVPRIYFKGDDFLFIEYLGGKTLLDEISGQESISQKEPSFNKQSNKAIDSIIEKVCSCLNSCYSEMKKATGKSIILGDMNLRNFVLKNTFYGDELYRIDFEDCRTGIIEEDLGSFCAFILSYYPALTEWKVGLARKFIISFQQSFSIDINILKKEIEKSLSTLYLRRGDKYPKGLITITINTI
jgi:hypothetical protein